MRRRLHAGSGLGDRGERHVELQSHRRRSQHVRKVAAPDERGGQGEWSPRGMDLRLNAIDPRVNGQRPERSSLTPVEIVALPRMRDTCRALRSVTVVH